MATLLRWVRLGYVVGFAALVLALAVPRPSRGQFFGPRAPVSPFLGLSYFNMAPSVIQAQSMLQLAGTPLGVGLSGGFGGSRAGFGGFSGFPVGSGGFRGFPVGYGGFRGFPVGFGGFTGFPIGFGGLGGFPAGFANVGGFGGFGGFPVGFGNVGGLGGFAGKGFGGFNGKKPL